MALQSCKADNKNKHLESLSLVLTTLDFISDSKACVRYFTPFLTEHQETLGYLPKKVLLSDVDTTWIGCGSLLTLASPRDNR
jgi:hypothetical protein